MNSNEVNAVIDNLCDKLGIAAQNITQLVPSLVKLSIINDLGWFIGCMALAILFFMLARKAKRKEELETICDIYWKPILFGIANACADFAEFEVQTGDFEMVAWLFNEGKRRIAEFTEWAAGGKKSV